MKKSRTEEFASRQYVSQGLVQSHKISKDYLLLVGLFFHFWGYIDLYLNEKCGGTTKDKIEDKVNNCLPHDMSKRILADGESNGLQKNIYNVRNTLAHQPMMIHRGVNIGVCQFVSGWVYKNYMTTRVKNYPKPAEDVKYYPIIDERQILFSISLILEILIDFKVPSELEYTVRIMMNSEINLVEYVNKYFQLKIDNDLKKMSKEDQRFEQKNIGYSVRNIFRNLQKLKPKEPKREIIQIPKEESMLMSWAREVNRDRIISQYIDKNDGDFCVLGTRPTTFNGTDSKSNVLCKAKNEFEALRSLASLNGEDWI